MDRPIKGTGTGQQPLFPAFHAIEPGASPLYWTPPVFTLPYYITALARRQCKHLAFSYPRSYPVFFFGVFFKRMNAAGCLATLVAGFAMGIGRLIVDTPVSLFGKSYEPGSVLWIINNMFFQYYSILILLVCIVVFYVVSYATRAPDYAHIGGLTYRVMNNDKAHTDTDIMVHIKELDVMFLGDNAGHGRILRLEGFDLIAGQIPDAELTTH